MKLRKLLPVVYLLGTSLWAVAADVDFKVILPQEASVIVGPKVKHFVDVVPVAPASIDDNADGTRTWHFTLPRNSNNDFCAYMPGKLTQKGYFTAGDVPLVITTDHFNAMDPHAVNHHVDANDGYESGDIFVNINPEGYLRLNVGDSFMAHAMRSWEITDSPVNNHFMEPDFRYAVIDLDGSASTGVITVRQQPGNAWAELKAVAPGTAIVLVAYDALHTAYYSADGTKSAFLGGEFWGACWPENTAAFVVSVGLPQSAVVPDMFINEEYNADTRKLAGKNVDAEHDVFYYLDSDDGARYTFTPHNAADITLARPVIGEHMASYGGFGHEGVTRNADGSCTLLLKEGRQIVRMTDADGNAAYQVLTAKPCSRQIINETHPLSSCFVPGDRVSIQFTGLRHPANKMAGIYNMSAYLTYNGTPNGTALTLTPNQYKFGSTPSA